MGEINLKLYQKKHVENIIEHLKLDKIYIDGSPMGSGKTFTTNEIANILNIPMYIICPLSLKYVWSEISTLFDNKIINIESYQSMRGKKNDLFYLDKDNNFIPTGLLEYDKFILVFDEFHNLKNESRQGLYAKKLIEYTLQNNKNVVALLSATPIDKESQVFNFIKLLGISNSYFKIDIVEDLIKKIKHMSTIKKLHNIKILDKINLTGNLDKIAIELLKIFIIPNYMFCMKVSNYNDNIKIDIKNGYYKTSIEKVEKMRMYYYNLSKLLKYNYNEEKQLVATVNKNSFSKIQKILHKIEREKIESISRIATKILQSNKNCKLIIYLNYISSILELENDLENFNPLVLMGSVKEKNRYTVISNFQADNNNYRVLLSNMQVGGVGLSLDDIYGTHPRYMLISPSYNFMNIHQSIGRIFRITSKSNSVIRLFYSKGVKEEKILIDSLARKADLMKSISCENNKVKYLHELENYVE